MTSLSSPSAFAKPTVETNVLVALGRWLCERRELGCTRVTLMQYLSDTAHDVVDEWTLDHLDDTEAFARALYATCLREAEALRAPLSYGVFAFKPDRPEPRGRFLFSIEMPKSAAAIAARPGDERSELIKLLMTHTDASARLSLGHSRGILDQYERLIEQANTQQGRLLDQAQKRIAELEGREAEAMEVRRQLQSIAVDRERELAKIRERNETFRYGISQLKEIAPLIAMAVAQRASSATTSTSAPSAAPVGAATERSAPASDRTVEEAIDRFFGSMTSEQLVVLAQMLRPEQHAQLAELNQLVRVRVAATGAATPAQAPAPETPVATAPVAPSAPEPAPAAPEPASGGAAEATLSRSNETATEAPTPPPEAPTAPEAPNVSVAAALSEHDELAKHAPANTNVTPPTEGTS